MSTKFDYYLGSIKEEIKADLIEGYNMGTSLLIYHLYEAGVETYHLQERDSLFNIVKDFLNLCRRYDLKKLDEIFRKLYKLSPGLSSLEKAQDILEKANYRETNFTNIPKTKPPKTKPPISKPLIQTPDPVDKQTVEKLEPNLDPEIYGKLEHFLQNQKWKEADLETMNVLVKIADIFANPNQFLKDRKKITWPDKKEVNNIPDEALKNIDKLWSEHTQGHFGFNVQLKIWSQYQRKPHKFDFNVYQDKFSQSVGWCDGKNWIKKYDEFNFSSEAKPGHLPSLSFPDQKTYEIRWPRWKETYEHLLQRLFNCGLI